MLKITENQTAAQAQARLNLAAIASLQPGSSLAYVSKLEQYASEWVARIRERRIAMEDEQARLEYQEADIEENEAASHGNNPGGYPERRGA